MGKNLFLFTILQFKVVEPGFIVILHMYQIYSLPESLVNVLSFCKNLTYSMFSIFLMLLLSSHRVFSPMYSSKPSMVWKPLWCKYRTVLSLGVIYKLFCRQCSWKEDRKNQSISWVFPVQWYTMGSKKIQGVFLFVPLWKEIY